VDCSSIIRVLIKKISNLVSLTRKSRDKSNLLSLYLTLFGQSYPLCFGHFHGIFSNLDSVFNQLKSSSDISVFCILLTFSSFQWLFDYLYPLRSPVRWFKWICKIESFMCDFAIPELHDGHPIDWTLIFIRSN
jgi:hypothetical protein